MSYAPNEMPSPEAGRGIPRELSRREIEEFLLNQRIARLGCHAGGTTYVVPLIYAYEDGAVVAVTGMDRTLSPAEAWGCPHRTVGFG